MKFSNRHVLSVEHYACGVCVFLMARYRPLRRRYWISRFQFFLYSRRELRFGRKVELSNPRICERPSSVFSQVFVVSFSKEMEVKWDERRPHGCVRTPTTSR